MTCDEQKLLSMRVDKIVIEAPRDGQWVTLREESSQDDMLVVHEWHLPKLIEALKTAAVLLD
ncbi:hypothetical protein CPPEL_03055 [Corynebacterium pseudopelargi]|uniref:Uncharacterized protein n=2 Tax=Corynebacterium pseudopelargi TaxID=2080757 RepID=A0A3G6ISX1_9CORY|nr:hypothetical protein CPPEL_03055 [Corynebacterium pseudopelargi]